MKNIIFARSRGVQKIFLDGFYRNGQGARTNTCNIYNYGSRSPPSDFFPFPYFFGLPREKKYKKNLREIFLSKDYPHPKKLGSISTTPLCTYSWTLYVGRIRRIHICKAFFLHTSLQQSLLLQIINNILAAAKMH